MPKILVKLILHITSQEAEIYAGIKGIKFTQEILFPETYRFIESLEKYHPDAKFGLLRSRKLIGELK